MQKKCKAQDKISVPQLSPAPIYSPSRKPTSPYTLPSSWYFSPPALSAPPLPPAIKKPWSFFGKFGRGAPKCKKKKTQKHQIIKCIAQMKIRCNKTFYRTYSKTFFLLILIRLQNEVLFVLNNCNIDLLVQGDM